MRAFAHVIVEELNGHWSAWFSGTPQIGVGGQWPADALRRLLNAFGSELLIVDEIVTVDEAVRDGHLEFLIPYRELRRIPEVSMN